jgi:hypothetical protein
MLQTNPPQYVYSMEILEGANHSRHLGGGGGLGEVKRFLDSRVGINCRTPHDLGSRLQTFLDSGKGDSHSWMSGREGGAIPYLWKEGRAEDEPYCI